MARAFLVIGLCLAVALVGIMAAFYTENSANSQAQLAQTATADSASPAGAPLSHSPSQMGAGEGGQQAKNATGNTHNIKAGDIAADRGFTPKPADGTAALYAALANQQAEAFSPLGCCPGF